MELLQLTYFCRAAETESFAETAREFGVPAAGISQSIKRLETELGAILFDRSPNGIKLNARGEAFYLSAKSALSMLEDARRKVRDEEISGECCLLVMTCRELVGKAIRSFCQKYTNVSFHISYDLAEDVDQYDLIIYATFISMHQPMGSQTFYDEKCTMMRKTNTAASNCVGCGKCEKHCPQGIAIRQELKKASKELEGPLYRIARRIVQWYRAF